MAFHSILQIIFFYLEQFEYMMTEFFFILGELNNRIEQSHHPTFFYFL